MTPAASVQCLPSATRCQDVSGGRAGRLWGTTKNRQEQVEHDRVGCRSLGVLLPQRQVGMWQTAVPLWRGKNTEGGGLPGENVCGGIRSPPDLVLLHTTRPCCVTAGGGGGGGGVHRAICGGFTVLPNLPKPLHVIRDKDRGLSYSTSILLASQKTAHP